MRSAGRHQSTPERIGRGRARCDIHFARPQIVQRLQHQAERLTRQRADGPLAAVAEAVGLQHRHFTGNRHAGLEWRDPGWQELVLQAHHVHYVADHGSE